MRVIDYPYWVTLARQAISFDDLLARILEQVVDQAPNGAIGLAGYSLGGSMAYGLALALERMGRKVAFVGLFDSEPPPAPRPAGAAGRARDTLGRIRGRRNLGHTIWNNVLRRTPLRLLSLAPWFWRAFPLEVRDNIDQKLRETTMIVLTRHWQRKVDRRSERLTVPLTLFQASETAHSTPNVADWRHRSSAVETNLVGGNHMSMMDGDHLEGLTAAFKAAVLKAFS
jgi:thioesterase domain-containing protein